MRSLSPAFAAELANGVTTLCRCWRTVRRDGTVFGFTDHDRDISFDGTTFLAQTGLDASEAVTTLGFAVGGGDISGAIVADAIAESDIAAGLWDDAAIETWQVDWREPERRLLIDAGLIGEISRSGSSFTAEIRSLASQFDQQQGRRYEAMCSAQLGDDHCAVDLAKSGHVFLTTIATVSDQSTFAVAGIVGLASGSLTHGMAVLQSADSSPVRLPIMAHTRAGNMDVISLWNVPAFPLLAGASVTLQAGCDKRFSTCRDRFANAINFRGFPYIPGNDFLMSYARQGDVELDGGAVIS